MDRSWMNASRISEEYENGIEQLLKFAKQNRPEPDGKYLCPCINCLNGRRHEEEKIREHLVCDGINKNYTIWIWHGESLNAPIEPNEPNNEEWENRFDDMIRDVGIQSFHQSHVYDDLKSDSEIPLYPGCKNFTRLSAVLQLVNVKAKNGWSDKSFTELLELLKDMLPKDNTLPNRTYEAKKILCPMGMEYKKIHACPNERKNTMQSVGIKWRQFKANLTSTYVFGKYKEKSPCEHYAISNDDWAEFKKTRLDEAWAEKRLKAQEIQRMNTAPHTLSRGGYLRLEEMMLEDKQRTRQEDLSSSDNNDISLNPPSPPTRHQMYKRARTKKNGEATSDAARNIITKIDELEENEKQGTFIPEGRQDILTTAIGKPEHPGRVRGVGAGVGIRSYFGGRSCNSTSSSISPELLQKITMEVTKNLVKTFGPAFESFNDQSPATHEKVHKSDVAHISTKGSCIDATPPSTGEETHIDISNRVELYIDEQPQRMVALGRVYDGASTLHGISLSNNLVKVVVEEVRYADAVVPVPTDEVKSVGQAIGGFINAWPKALVKSIPSAKEIEHPMKQVRPIRTEDPIRELINITPFLYDNPLQVEWDTNVFGYENDIPLCIHHNDVLEIITGKTLLNISTIRFWILFLKSLNFEMENDDLYGYFDPQSIQSIGSKKEETIKYMLKHVKDSKKKIYLGAYHHASHWQLLVIVPKDRVAVWLCPLHRKLPVDISSTVQSVVSLNLLEGSKHTSKSKHSISWITPKCNKQKGSWESGYYVMHWMRTIVQANIQENWNEVFTDISPLDQNDIDDIRARWASYFIENKNGTLDD